MTTRRDAGSVLLHAAPADAGMVRLPLDGAVLHEDQVRLGLWMFLATVTMLFAAFASAYIVRQSGSDWHPVALPSILWINTIVLAASSLALEGSNRLGRRRRWAMAVVAAGGACALGVAFLAGQMVAWRQMVTAGVYLPSNPHSSFFYMLTGAHAVHVVAALAVLAWVTATTWSLRGPSRQWMARMEIGRTFWHYLGVVWIGLLGLMSL